MNSFEDALQKAGITKEFLLKKTEEFIDAIKSGEYKPRHKEKVLARLVNMRLSLLDKIDTIKNGN